MDFHAARRMFESDVVPEAQDQPNKSANAATSPGEPMPTVIGIVGASSVSQMSRSVFAPLPPPVLYSGELPLHSPLPGGAPRSPLIRGEGNSHMLRGGARSPLSFGGVRSSDGESRSPLSGKGARSSLSSGVVATARSSLSSGVVARGRSSLSSGIVARGVEGVLEEEGRDGSDYSDVGDYSADKEFYVPGVNEGGGEMLMSAVSGAKPELEGEWEGGESEASYGEEGEEEEEEEEGGFVRQHSNFSRLSAQSWLTVDSAQDVDVEEGATESVVGGTGVGGVELIGRATGVGRNVALLPDRSYAEEDHDPTTLFGVDVEGGLMDLMAVRPLKSLSVFECCALLQAGVAALKKKSFRRFGARRVWLSADCDMLAWTSKKDGIDEDHIKLHKVAKMKCVDRKVSIDVTEGYRISLLFADANESGLCARALSCLIPLQARIRAPVGVQPPDKEREDYTLTDDSFNGKPLREYMAVNSYVVLCSARGQPQGMGSKLAFSRSDGSFCGLRYVPWRLVPLMLRSQEEIAVLKRLQHPNIVKYHECLQDTERGGHYVIFEYLARGSLMDSSKLEGVKTFPENTARDMIRDVVAGLTYLHNLRIAHGDMRPDNILRAVDGTVKINPIGCITHDFTEIQNLPMLVSARLGDVSPAFLAPELCWLSDAPKAHAKSYAMDVWSLGAVLYFMLYGRVPFGGRTDQEIQDSICMGKLRFPRHPETSRKVRSLLKGILGEKDPKTRIALSELENHPWFTEATGAKIDGYREPTRLIVSPAEVDSAVQVAKVKVATRKS